MPETGSAATRSATSGSAARTTAEEWAAERPVIVCSFCVKPTTEVESMVAGPAVYICNECVDLCVQIIAAKGDSEPIPPSWEQRLSDDDLLAMLPKIAATGVQVDRQLDKFVRHARSRGITWTRIGTALGTTRQSAWERFSGED
ncbi:MAG TPA: ClpX C4-type zinc finger protein [Streptosporangiaceae bacterium]